VVEYMPSDPENDAEYNARGGKVITPGSKSQREYQKWEQFKTKWTADGEPGNPYKFREFPMMVYKAFREDGNVMCMMPQPSPLAFKEATDLQRAQAYAEQFNKKCQMTVFDSAEYQKAMEGGWRESPQEAEQYVHNIETERANITAAREYEDRNMSEMAKREIAEAKAAVGGEHVPEVVEAPKRKCSKCGETGHNARSCKA